MSFPYQAIAATHEVSRSSPPLCFLSFNLHTASRTPSAFLKKEGKETERAKASRFNPPRDNSCQRVRRLMQQETKRAGAGREGFQYRSAGGCLLAGAASPLFLYAFSPVILANQVHVQTAKRIAMRDRHLFPLCILSAKRLSISIRRSAVCWRGR